MFELYVAKECTYTLFFLVFLLGTRVFFIITGPDILKFFLHKLPFFIPSPIPLFKFSTVKFEKILSHSLTVGINFLSLKFILFFNTLECNKAIKLYKG